MLFALLMVAANELAWVTVEIQDAWKERRRRSARRVAGPPWWHGLALVRLLRWRASAHPSVVVRLRPEILPPLDSGRILEDGFAVSETGYLKIESA
jgi:hypothetical protein